MTPEQLEQFKDEMKAHVSDTIRVVVNGKIDNISQKLGDYVKADEEWKQRAEPFVKAFENTSWLFKLTIGTLKLLGLLGVSIAAIVTIKNFLAK